MASEDSDQIGPGLLTVHRLDDFGDLDQTLAGQMRAGRHHLDAQRELLEVTPLRRVQRSVAFPTRNGMAAARRRWRSIPLRPQNLKPNRAESAFPAGFLHP